MLLNLFDVVLGEHGGCVAHGFLFLLRLTQWHQNDTSIALSFANCPTTFYYRINEFWKGPFWPCGTGTHVYVCMHLPCSNLFQFWVCCGLIYQIQLQNLKPIYTPIIFLGTYFLHSFPPYPHLFFLVNLILTIFLVLITCKSKIIYSAWYF